MSWLREEIAPAPHLIDPADTRKAAKAFYMSGWWKAQIREEIAKQKRAIEHEQACLEGMIEAYEAHGHGRYSG